MIFGQNEDQKSPLFSKSITSEKTIELMFHKDILVTLEKTTKKSKVLIDYLSIFLGNSFISTMMQNLANFIETAGIKPNSRNIPQLLKGKGEFSSAGPSQHG